MDFAEGKLKREDQACDMQTRNCHSPYQAPLGRGTEYWLQNYQRRSLDDDNLHGPA